MAGKSVLLKTTKDNIQPETGFDIELSVVPLSTGASQSENKFLIHTNAYKQMDESIKGVLVWGFFFRKFNEK